MISFIHTADIHFGVENYGKIDTATGIHTRLLDFEKSLQTCIDYALDKNVDFFLFVGDAYKTAHPTPTQQKLFLRCFLQLYQAKIPVVMVIGNHDNPLSLGKAHSLDIFNDLPLEGFFVISEIQRLLLSTKNGPVQIIGVPWPTRTTLHLNKKWLASESFYNIASSVTQKTCEKIIELKKECDPKIPTILAGHLTVCDGIFSGSEKKAIYGNDPLFSVNDLITPPCDYVALGHLHRYQNLNNNNYPAVVYSGSIDRIDFGERKEEKGFCLVHLEKNKTNYTFIPLNTRPFIQIEFNLKPQENNSELLVKEIQRHSIKDSIVKIIYFVTEESIDTIDLQAIEYACRQAHYLVGIIPIYQSTFKSKRLLNKPKNLEDLLLFYFENTPHTKNHKNDFLKKALALYNQALECETE